MSYKLLFLSFNLISKKQNNSVQIMIILFDFEIFTAHWKYAEAKDLERGLIFFVLNAFVYLCYCFQKPLKVKKSEMPGIEPSTVCIDRSGLVMTNPAAFPDVFVSIFLALDLDTVTLETCKQVSMARHDFIQGYLWQSAKVLVSDYNFDLWLFFQTGRVFDENCRILMTFNNI